MSDTIEDLVKRLRVCEDPSAYLYNEEAEYNMNTCIQTLVDEAATALEEQAAEIKRLEYIVTNMLAGESKLRAGYAVVPVEPTEAMLMAVPLLVAGIDPSYSNHTLSRKVYKIMLEAAKETDDE